jgi:hypothetical protein
MINNKHEWTLKNIYGTDRKMVSVRWICSEEKIKKIINPTENCSMFFFCFLGIIYFYKVCSLYFYLYYYLIDVVVCMCEGVILFTVGHTVLGLTSFVCVFFYTKDLGKNLFKTFWGRADFDGSDGERQKKLFYTKDDPNYYSMDMAFIFTSPIYLF